MNLSRLFCLFLLAFSIKAQSIHMWAGASTFTDASNTVWTPNTCQNTLLFSNPGTYPNPIYNQAAYSPNQQTSITCAFPVPQGVYTVDLHLIEPVKSFNADGKRVFSIFANGHAVANNVDIFQQANGVELPLDVTGLIVAGVNGITVTFNPSVSSAIFSGIELCLAKLSPFANVFVNGSPIGTAASLNIVSGNGINCQAIVNAPVGTLNVQCGLSAVPPLGSPGFLYADGAGNFIWAPVPSFAVGGGLGTNFEQSSGALSFFVNPVFVPLVGVENTFTGAFNDFSASALFLPGSRGATRPACVQSLEGTDWYLPGGAVTSGTYQICQNQNGVFQWVIH